MGFFDRGRKTQPSPEQGALTAKEWMEQNIKTAFTAKNTIQGRGEDAMIIPKQGNPIQASEYLSKLKGEIEGMQDRMDQLKGQQRQTPLALELQQKKALWEVVNELVG